MTLGHGPQAGPWRDVFTGEPTTLQRDGTLTLPVWGYRLLVGT